MEMDKVVLPSWQYAPLLLASASPRRYSLLTEAGFQFRVAYPEVEEIYPETLPVQDVPIYLAGIKNLAARPLAQPGEVILTADSIVVLDGKIYGKPKDTNDAFDILNTIQGKTHTVITGICLSKGTRIWTAAASTEVSICAMNQDEIQWYVNQYSPLDKAGAYGVQEWVGLCKIQSIIGSYANVVGLPVHLVYDAFVNKVV